jgi:DNA-binding FadR family transcriptional regulator
MEEYIFKKADPNSLVYFVSQQIEAAIVEGRFREGDRLPSINQLQEMLGTGRSTIREALSILTQKGLVETKRGAGGGTFVRAIGSQSVIESLGLLIRTKKISRDQILQFRECYEAPAAGLAVETAETEEIEKLKELLAEAEKLANSGVAHWDDFYLVEAEMHVTLLTMTHNIFIETVATVIAQNDRYYRSYLPREERNVREALGDWYQMIDALEKREKQRAEDVAKAHLKRNFQYLAQFQEKHGRRQAPHDTQ